MSRELTTLAAVAGSGAQRKQQALLESLLGRVTTEEQGFLIRLLLGEPRQGAVAGMSFGTWS